MTTVIILLLGGGAVLISSAIESNPDGSDVSVIQTIQDIWNDKLNFQQGNTPSSNSSGNNNNNNNFNSTQFNPGGFTPLSSNAAPTSQIQQSSL